jgi:cob(I)alamin adenosyltransferase
MILVYTGNGKGKTSASVGQAIRAHGQGLRVAFGQFMKRPAQAGEQIVLAELLGQRFFANGPGFFRNEKNRQEQREAAVSLLAWAEDMLAAVDMLILDESLYALAHDLLLPEEIDRLAEKASRTGVHLVLSGRKLPDWLKEKADLVTEMVEKKHPFAKGCQALPGIEF